MKIRRSILRPSIDDGQPGPGAVDGSQPTPTGDTDQTPTPGSDTADRVKSNAEQFRSTQARAATFDGSGATGRAVQ
jgi:hypothetical protein